jgi:lipoic acid synthetase
MLARERRFPDWIRRQWPSGEAHQEVKALLEGLNLHTVCQSAHCPNQGECWSRRTATFLVLGNVCTRHCAFCGVSHGAPLPVDQNEPEKVAEAVMRLGAKHVVITSVTRDDLDDGGAGHIARTVSAVKEKNCQTTVEVLVPDFGGDATAIATVIASKPEVFGHNMETVERLHPLLRDSRYSYGRSIEVLKTARELRGDGFVKSALMLGCGESEEDVLGTLRDLHAAGCDAVAMGQYLRPGPGNGPVMEFVTPGQFNAYEQAAREIGFLFAVAGPFVRSSYRSDELLSAVPAGK